VSISSMLKELVADGTYIQVMYGFEQSLLLDRGGLWGADKVWRSFGAPGDPPQIPRSSNSSSVLENIRPSTAVELSIHSKQLGPQSCNALLLHHIGKGS
jgi:hypothetical protein